MTLPEIKIIIIITIIIILSTIISMIIKINDIIINTIIINIFIQIIIKIIIIVKLSVSLLGNTREDCERIVHWPVLPRRCSRMQRSCRSELITKQFLLL